MQASRFSRGSKGQPVCDTCTPHNGNRRRQRVFMNNDAIWDAPGRTIYNDAISEDMKVLQDQLSARLSLLQPSGGIYQLQEAPGRTIYNSTPDEGTEMSESDIPDSPSREQFVHPSCDSSQDGAVDMVQHDDHTLETPAYEVNHLDKFADYDRPHLPTEQGTSYGGTRPHNSDDTTKSHNNRDESVPSSSGSGMNPCSNNGGTSSSNSCGANYCDTRGGTDPHNTAQDEANHEQYALDEYACPVDKERVERVEHGDGVIYLHLRCKDTYPAMQWTPYIVVRPDTDSDISLKVREYRRRLAMLDSVHRRRGKR